MQTLLPYPVIDCMVEPISGLGEVEDEPSGPDVIRQGFAYGHVTRRQPAALPIDQPESTY